MPISYGQYHARSNIIRNLLRNYIDDSFEWFRTGREIEETTLLTISIPKLSCDKIIAFLRNVLHCQVSLEELEIADSNNTLLNICLDSDGFHHTNLTHLATTFESYVAPKSTYLILDSDEVFGGKAIHPSDEDIVLETYDCGSTNVLKNGYQTIQHLNELTERFDYKIIFYSNSRLRDQALLLTKLHAACTRHNVTFPKVHAMVCEQSSEEMPITSSLLDDVLIVTWSAPLTAQEALETALSIHKEERHLHHVFGESGSDLSRVINEGYQGYLLGDTQATSFNTILDQILVDAKQKSALIAASIKDVPKVITTNRFFLDSESHSKPHIETTKASPPLANRSSLTEAQQLEIGAMINGFKKKIDSFWYRDKERRRQKVTALENLLQYCNTMNLRDAVTEVDKNFPNISKGNLRDLLRRLSSEAISHEETFTTRSESLAKSALV